jgi:hypothetical protein
VKVSTPLLAEASALAVPLTLVLFATHQRATFAVTLSPAALRRACLLGRPDVRESPRSGRSGSSWASRVSSGSPAACSRHLYLLIHFSQNTFHLCRTSVVPFQFRSNVLVIRKLCSGKLICPPGASCSFMSTILNVARVGC